MLKTTLSTIWLVSGLLIGQSAWAVTITCTSSGPGVAGCQTDPNFPNTWFIPAMGENEPAAEQTMTITFVGDTITNTSGLFNILDEDGTTISDQIQVRGIDVGGNQIVFTSDPFSPLSGGTNLTNLPEIPGQGVVVDLQIHLDQLGFTDLFIGSDSEAVFNPIGIAGGIDLSDYICVQPFFGSTSCARPVSAPEPASLALLGVGLAGIALIRRKRPVSGSKTQRRRSNYNRLPLI